MATDCWTETVLFFWKKRMKMGQVLFHEVWWFCYHSYMRIWEASWTWGMSMNLKYDGGWLPGGGWKHLLWLSPHCSSAHSHLPNQTCIPLIHSLLSKPFDRLMFELSDSNNLPNGNKTIRPTSCATLCCLEPFFLELRNWCPYAPPNLHLLWPLAMEFDYRYLCPFHHALPGHAPFILVPISSLIPLPADHRDKQIVILRFRLLQSTRPHLYLGIWEGWKQFHGEIPMLCKRDPSVHCV